MPEKNIDKIGLIAIIAVFALAPMGILGAIFGENNRATGFLWGVGIGIALFAVMFVGMFGWERIKKEAEEGRLRPYMLCGALVAVAICGWFAISLGNPSCEEVSDDPVRSSCVEYADNGFEATTEQRWSEFWSKLPVVLIICLLVAYIVHGQAEKNRPKHFKSDNDRFTVGIFPETISVNLDEDGNSYKYRPYDDMQYGIEVIALDDFPSDRSEVSETVEHWHKQIVSAATKVNTKDVEVSSGKKEHIPYLYSQLPLKKGLVYCQLTLSKNGKIYYLTMHLHADKNDSKTDVDEMFFHFVDSFRFTD